MITFENTKTGEVERFNDFNSFVENHNSRVSLSGEKTKEIIRRLIYAEFHSFGADPLPHEISEQEDLIKTAIAYGLSELANELKKDICHDIINRTNR